MTDNISKKDKKDWETFLSSNEKLPNKDLKLKQRSSIKTRSIDLHGHTLDDANKVINDFIENCYEEKVNKIIVVTGKGLHSKNEKDPYVSKDLGILKYSIPNFLNNNTELMKMISNISGASINDGGSGAFYIFLKKK